MFSPQRFGRYLLVSKLATGGMAEIFLAKLRGAEGFEKEIVIKKILPQWSQDTDFVGMLIDEAKIAVQLNHPNIVQIHELAREDEAFYIAMEYVHGVDLRRLMQKTTLGDRKIPLEVSLTIVREMLEGLAYAHAKRDPKGRPMEIIHRDISPQNVLVSFDGTVKITDFGIARAASRSHETIGGVLKGKFAYMSPEQANQETLDLRSDLFSAGVVLYEMVTGERLFYRGSDIDTLDRVRRGQVTFSPKADKILPPRLKEILTKALAKRREDRYPDAATFREEILRLARRSKKDLRRDKVGAFVSGLFAEEITQQMEEDTKRLTQATTLLLDETRSLATKEIFVRREEMADLTTVASPVIPEPIPPSVRPSFPRRVGKRVWLAGSLTVSALLILLVVTLRPSKEISNLPASPPPPHSRENPLPPEAPPPPVREGQAISADIEIPPPVVSEEKKGGSAPEVETGFLNVQAVPWGYVTIDGGKRLETPVRRLPLKAGRHTVKVFQGPNLAAASHITVVGGEEVVCVASFRDGGKEIRCGK